MDLYSKAVLTIIAISLSLIAAKMWEPREAHAAVFGSGPTFGELLDTPDPDARKRLVRNVPVVKVFGTVDVN